MFEDNEKVCNNTSINDTRTYHIMTRDKIYSILNIDDIYLSAYRSYNMEEVDHQLCSYGTMDGIGPNNQRKGIIFYGWSISCRGGIIVYRNDCNNLRKLRAEFSLPKLTSEILGKDRHGNDKKSYAYVFNSSNEISRCRNFKITYFCPIVLQINPKKVTVKLIASRACTTIGKNYFNKSYSSS